MAHFPPGEGFPGGGVGGLSPLGRQSVAFGVKIPEGI